MAVARATWGPGSLAVSGSAALRLRRGAEQAERQEGPVAGRRHTSCGRSAGPPVRGEGPGEGHGLQAAVTVRGGSDRGRHVRDVPVRARGLSIPFTAPAPLTFRCVLFGDSFRGLSV